MLKLVSFHIQAHLNAFLQILEYFSHNLFGASGERITLYNIKNQFSDVTGTRQFAPVKFFPKYMNFPRVAYFATFPNAINDLACQEAFTCVGKEQTAECAQSDIILEKE
jgi:hypothetical protein